MPALNSLVRGSYPETRLFLSPIGHFARVHGVYELWGAYTQQHCSQRARTTKQTHSGAPMYVCSMSKTRVGLWERLTFLQRERAKGEKQHTSEPRCDSQAGAQRLARGDRAVHGRHNPTT